MKDHWDNIDELIADTQKVLDGEIEPPAPEQEPENYSDWLYRQDGTDPASVEPPVRDRKSHRKKKHIFLKILLGLLILLVAAFAALWFLFAKQPVSQKDAGLGERKPGNSVILLAGTDAGETRTDTMVLLSVNEPEKTVSLISVPRDTYLPQYGGAKLNAALGAGGGGAEGMEELMDRMEELTGYWPDGYVLVNLDGFKSIVDAIGGVKFNVPMDMDYEDPYQDLYIHLKAGEQTLDGEQSMELVRFRSGYARADLERVEVQRDFLKAALKQTLQLKNIVKAPRLLTTVLANSTTDMDIANLTWLAKAMLVCDKDELTMETLAGYPQMIGGASYFVVSPQEAAEQLNRCCNPYQNDIPADWIG